MQGDHVVKTYDEELNRLKRMILEMGEKVGRQLEDTLMVIQSPDRELASRIVEDDRAVNAMEESVSGLSVRMLALRQPVADDLRSVITALRMSVDIERIGDYAANTARRIVEVGPLEPVSVMEKVLEMGRMVRRMLSAVLDAYGKHDADGAVKVWCSDRVVDATYTSVIEELRREMQRDPGKVAVCTDLLFMARSMERTGDHIKNLAEQTYFLVRGKPLWQDISECV